MYYLISTEYIGPNTHDSDGNILGDTRRMYIQTVPGRTSSSHEVRILGELGTTTDDIYGRAFGEYVTLEAARAKARWLGFTAESDEEIDEDGDIVEVWISAEAAREQWAAD